MVVVTDTDRARYRAAIARTLIDSLAIVRTGLALPCRITAATQEVRIPGLPSWYRVRRWDIAFAYDGDVVAGDHATKTGKRYCIAETTGGDSVNAENLTEALLFVASASGSIKRNPSSMSGGGNITTAQASVTFRSLSSQLIIPVSSQDTEDMFGVELVQGGWVLMDNPTGSTVRYPARVGDWAVIGSVTYPIRAVLPGTGFNVLYLDIPATS